MVAITKPDLENIWASEGGVMPPDLNTILTGWYMNQIPPSEIANFLQNKVELAIKYILQMGIAEWYPTIEYQKNSIVKFGEKHYRAKEVSLDKNPSTDTVNWVIAWDEYGSSDDLRDTVLRILGEDGFLPHYVRKADPVMTAKAKAPSFEADVGATGGYFFKGYATGVYCVGGDLIFSAGGNSNGRIKSEKLTLQNAQADNTLVTMEFLLTYMEEFQKSLTKRMEIQIGQSIITRHRKPPSDSTQLGYGVWELDCQGRALVGVSVDTAITTPEWVKDADSRTGEYEHTMTIEELVNHGHDMGGRWQDGGSGGVQGGNKSDSYIASTNKTGGGKPFNIVQPSHTKFIWTRIA